MKNNEIGHRIKTIITKLGYKQQGIAEKVGVPASNLSRWVRGDVAPTLINLIRLADVLNVSLDFLIRGVEFEQEYVSHDNKDIDQNIRPYLTNADIGKDLPEDFEFYGFNYKMCKKEVFDILNITKVPVSDNFIINVEEYGELFKSSKILRFIEFGFDRNLLLILRIYYRKPASELENKGFKRSLQKKFKYATSINIVSHVALAHKPQDELIEVLIEDTVGVEKAVQKYEDFYNKNL